MDVEQLSDELLAALDNQTLFLAIERMINRLPEEGKSKRLRQLGRCVTDVDWYLKQYHREDLTK